MTDITTRPTHVLKLRSRDNKLNTRVVGHAWHNPEHGGYFSIQLGIGTVISWRDCVDCQLGLFANEPSPDNVVSFRKRKKGIPRDPQD